MEEEYLGFFLALFDLGWIILILMIAILGGRVLVEVKNPFTKRMDSITDVKIDHQKVKSTK